MEETEEVESPTDSHERVLAVELWYRAGADCPLRAITHQPDGAKKPLWEKFQQTQDAPFRERTLPCRLPSLFHTFPMESSVIVLSAQRFFAFPVIREAQLAMCRNSLTSFLHTFQKALTWDQENGTVHFLYLHWQCIPFCMHGITSSLSCPPPPLPTVSALRPSE